MSNPTLEGRKHVIQIMAGGMTQYLTDVQQMPKNVEKQLVRTMRNFLWNDSMHSPVSLDYVMLPVDQGRLGILDVQARNEAIDLMWLKQYLTFVPECPLWAWLADNLFARNTTKSCKLKEDRLRVNPF